ncbi:MAG: hypothetical protein J7498_07170 [Sphingobium sp.]|nr:hypothetical protein [Sphingobium sp.]
MRRWSWREAIRALDDFAAREWRWLVAVAWLVISAWYLQLYSNSIHWFSLGDTDDNMRYLQVRDWLNGQGWWDLRQHRMNPPEGANIHWSRLVDLPLAALMLFFRLFMAPGAADRLACGVAPLLPLLPLMLALSFIATRLSRDDGRHGRGHAWFAAMLLPLGAGMGLGMYVPLRVDHHGWQLALTAVALAGLVDRKWVRGGIIAGIASAASVAIGMEMLVYLAGAGALIALRWVFKEGAARRLQPYALGLGGMTAIGYAFFASNDNRAPVCDALSPVWTSTLVLAAGLLLFISVLPLKGWPQRLIAGVLAGTAIAAFFWLVWPQCHTGVYQISPELEKSWLSYIREAKPLMSQPRASWVPMTAMPAAGLLCALFGCWSARRDYERLWAWGTVALMIAFALGLMFWQIRAAAAAQLIAIPPIAWAMWQLVVALFTARWWLKIGAVLGLAGLGTAAAAYEVYPIANRAIADLTSPATPAPKPAAPAVEARTKPTAAKDKTAAAPPTKRPANNGNRCRTLPALQPLDQLPAATIFTLVDLGPRMIAMTHHSAIAGPYHRNGTAILDIHHAFDGSPETFRKIAAAHGASYLLACPGFPEGTIYQARSPRGFYARVLRGEKFDFLKPVTLKFEGTLPYDLYRIAPKDKAGQVVKP